MELCAAISRTHHHQRPESVGRPRHQPSFREVACDDEVELQNISLVTQDSLNGSHLGWLPASQCAHICTYMKGVPLPWVHVYHPIQPATYIPTVLQKFNWFREEDGIMTALPWLAPAPYGAPTKDHLSEQFPRYLTLTFSFSSLHHVTVSDRGVQTHIVSPKPPSDTQFDVQQLPPNPRFFPVPWLGMCHFRTMSDNCRGSYGNAALPLFSADADPRAKVSSRVRWHRLSNQYVFDEPPSSLCLLQA